MVMIAISCVVRFWQEYRSNAAATRLQASVTNDVQVYRQSTEYPPFNGKRSDSLPEGTIVKAEDLVPGDILLINPGNSIPADCLLIRGNHLMISQSALTGE